MLKNVERRSFVKKLLTIVLTAVCVLSFSACDSDSSNLDDRTTTSTTTTTTTTTTTKRTTTATTTSNSWDDTTSYNVSGVSYRVPTNCISTSKEKDGYTYFYPDFGMISVSVTEDSNPNFENDTALAAYAEAFEDDDTTVTNYRTFTIQDCICFEMLFQMKANGENHNGVSLSVYSNGNIVDFILIANEGSIWNDYTKFKNNLDILEQSDITTTTKKTTTMKKKTTTTTTTTKQTIYNPTRNPNWGWQGSGDYVATDLKVSNYAVLTATHTGNSNFIVHAYDEDGSRIGLINEIGNYSGQVLIDESGVYEIEIIADGNWNISASGLSITDSTSFSGTGDSVTPIFNTSNRVWEISHTGQSNFIVHEYDVYDDRDGLVNEIGNYSGIVRSDLIGNCFFEILADGSWTIKPAS